MMKVNICRFHWKRLLIGQNKLFQYSKKADVNILRVGLHPSEGLLSGDELIAGPFHPSFKELVMTEIWRDMLKFVLQP